MKRFSIGHKFNKHPPVSSLIFLPASDEALLSKIGEPSHVGGELSSTKGGSRSPISLMRVSMSMVASPVRERDEGGGIGWEEPGCGREVTLSG